MMNMMKYLLVVLSTVTLGSSLAYASVECTDVQVQVLGAGGPELNDKESSSSYLIWHNRKARLLMDTGSGSSYHFDQAGADFNDLDGILLTHLHTDHSADLPAYIKGSFFTSRTRPLFILGPQGNAIMPSTEEFMQRLFGANGAFAYLQDHLDPKQADFPLRIMNMPIKGNTTRTVELADDLRVTSLPVEHGPVAAVAWRVDVGQCVIGYSGDMNGDNTHFANLVNNADLVIMHAAVPEHAGRVARHLHMTPSDIEKMVSLANIDTLVLSHFMNRTKGSVEELVNRLSKKVTHLYVGETALSINVGRSRPEE